MEHTLITFEENKKIVKNYSDPLEAGIARKKKLEQEGIRVFACNNCQKQFSQSDKEQENYLIDYSYAEVDWKDKGCQMETLLTEVKHKTCPK